MASDPKRVQSFINYAAETAQKLKEASAELDRMIAIYDSETIDLTGTPIENEMANIRIWADNVRLSANDPVTDILITAYVPSHNRL